MDKYQMTLFIGDKHLSSWSMRPWLLMKAFDIPFQEQLIRLDLATTKKEIEKISPTERVPVLVDHDLAVWDSLAICEYLAEKFPRLNIWPDSTKQRAWARSICAEMHSSFSVLRSTCPMTLLEIKTEKKDFSESLLRDIQRIDGIFQECREANSSKGPFLFGAFSVADAFYLPVISRIRSYNLPLKKQMAVDYYNDMTSSPLFKMWMEEAQKELV